MTTKIEINEAMVDRALDAAGGLSNGSRDAMRAALDAAMNPPAEPEIPVTSDMLEAAERKAFSWGWEFGREKCRAELTKAYRAMRALEPQTKPTVAEKAEVAAGIKANDPYPNSRRWQYEAAFTQAHANADAKVSEFQAAADPHLHRRQSDQQSTAHARKS